MKWIKFKPSMGNKKAEYKVEGKTVTVKFTFTKKKWWEFWKRNTWQ